MPHLPVQLHGTEDQAFDVASITLPLFPRPLANLWSPPRSFTTRASPVSHWSVPAGRHRYTHNPIESPTNATETSTIREGR
jgi:hypothetical protein